MCRATTCRRCGKPTWKGCGMHVEQVLGHVPKSKRCRCGSGDTGAAGAPVTPEKKRWFSRA